MKAFLKSSIFILCNFIFIVHGAFAQEYDDMYFNSNDRKAITEESERKVEKRKALVEQYNTSENYSANHVDPKIIERYKAEAKLADSLGLVEFNPEFDSTYYKKLLESADFAMSEETYETTQNYSQPTVYPSQQSNSIWNDSRFNVSFGYGFGSGFGWNNSFYRLGFGNRYGRFYHPAMDPYSPYYDPFFDPYDPFYSGLTYGYGYNYTAYYGRFNNGYYRPGGYYGRPVYVTEGSERRVVRGRTPSRSNLIRVKRPKTLERSSIASSRNRLVRSSNKERVSSSRNSNLRPSQNKRPITRSRYTRKRTTSQRAVNTTNRTYSNNNSNRSSSNYQRRTRSSSNSNRNSYSRSNSSSRSSSYSKPKSSSSSTKKSYSRSSNRSSSSRSSSGTRSRSTTTRRSRN